jgi:hypothetical protein
VCVYEERDININSSGTRISINGRLINKKIYDWLYVAHKEDDGIDHQCSGQPMGQEDKQGTDAINC